VVQVVTVKVAADSYDKLHQRVPSYIPHLEGSPPHPPRQSDEAHKGTDIHVETFS
jgi:hypothetical protein